jgi:hypothetical protein
MRYVAVLAAVLMALACTASAYSGGNTVTQSISMSASGGYVSQSASNSAVVMGNNNVVDQSITQTARGNHITQSAANAAVVVGDNNQVGQSINQRANGNTIAQSGANAVAVVGNYNLVDQRVNQFAAGNEIYQTGWNTGTIVGDWNVLNQQVLTTASTYTPPSVQPADPTQIMSNSAYIMGSYNDVGQYLEGYVMAGTSNAPVSQTANNYIQTYDNSYNDYEQRIGFRVRAGPLAPVMQSATNEVRIGF